jgi:hypothetical protein
MTQETFLVLSASRNPDSHSDPIGENRRKEMQMERNPRKRVKGAKGSALLSVILGMGFMLGSVNAHAGEAGNISRERADRQETHIQYNVIKAVQAKLIQKGYDPGPIDGIHGPRTRKALESYQRDHGLVVDGLPGKLTLKSLGLMY